MCALLIAMNFMIVANNGLPFISFYQQKMEIDEEENSSSSFKTIKETLKQLFVHETEIIDGKLIKKSPIAEKLTPSIKDQVEKISRIAIISSLRFYYHMYNLVLNGSEGQILHEFVQQERSQITPIPYDELDPLRKVLAFMRKINGTVQPPDYPNVVGFRNGMNKYDIEIESQQMNNSLNYAAVVYEQNLRANIQHYAYHRLQYIFKYILNQLIDPNTSVAAKKARMKENNKSIYTTLRHLFKGNQQPIDDEEVMNIDDEEAMIIDDEEAIVIDDSDEEDDDEDDDEETIMDDGEISQILINFVKEKLRPFDFENFENGKGALFGINSKKKYYSFIPMFVRLQKYICDIQKQSPSAIRSFTVIPTFGYQMQHIRIDISDLYKLYDLAGMNPKIGTGRKKTYNIKTFKNEKNANGIAKKWYDIFNIKKMDKKYTDKFEFSGTITTNGEDCSIIMKKVCFFYLQLLFP